MFSCVESAIEKLFLWRKWWFNRWYNWWYNRSFDFIVFRSKCCISFNNVTNRRRFPTYESPSVFNLKLRNILVGQSSSINSCYKFIQLCCKSSMISRFESEFELFHHVIFMNNRTCNSVSSCIRSHTPCNHEYFIIGTVNSIIINIFNCTS